MKNEFNYDELNAAYNWCMEQIDGLVEDGCCVPPAYRDLEKYNALNLASLCIAKQIPKPAEIKKDKFMNVRLYCPTCHKQQSQVLLGKEISCERCGQKLMFVEGSNVTEN